MKDVLSAAGKEKCIKMLMKQMANVEICTSGGLSKILINGEDFSNCVTKVTFSHDAANETPKVELTIAVGEVRLCGSAAIQCNADVDQIAKEICEKIAQAVQKPTLSKI